MSYNYQDPLFVVNPKHFCSVCKNEDPAKATCLVCEGTGYQPINLNGLWYPSAGFLVCGGPSINKMPYQILRERGIASLAVNNVAAHVPVAAWCFSDPQNKFHHGMYLDPKCITFAPIPKLRHHVVAKLPNKKFQAMDVRLRDCPTTFGFSRKTSFYAPEFFTTTWAMWGHGGKDTTREKPFNCLCTMLIGLRLMHYLGCPRVYLLGVDFWMEEGQQAYAFKQEKSARNGRYRKENDYLKELKPIFEQNKFEVYNCNPESKCDVFKHVPIEEALKDCRGGVPLEPFDTEAWYNKEDQAEDLKQNPKSLSIRDLSNIQNSLFEK